LNELQVKEYAHCIHLCPPLFNLIINLNIFWFSRTWTVARM
jgi:hypothetical protein